jgi:hypothetical protein
MGQNPLNLTAIKLFESLLSFKEDREFKAGGTSVKNN